MEKRKPPFLLAALLPLAPQVVAMGVAPLTTPQEGVMEASLHILLLMDLLTVREILTVHLEEVAPLEGVGEVLHIGLPMVEVEMGPPETEGALRALLKVLHIGLPVVEVDAPVEKVVLLVGVAEDRRGILAPLNLRILNPEDSPL